MRSVLSLWRREYEEESKARCAREVAADVTENGNYMLVSAMPRNGMKLNSNSLVIFILFWTAVYKQNHKKYVGF